MSSPLQVAYFIHGRGLEHAARSIPVAQRLRADGHGVTVHGGGDAIPLLADLDAWLPRPTLEANATALLRLPWRIAQDVANLGRERPDLVVSDGDQAALAAARTRGLRSLAIGHDLVFSSCALPDAVNATARRAQQRRGLIPTHLAEHRVAVHFLPVEAARDNTWVARPDGDASAATSNSGHYVAYFRDAGGGRVVEWLRAQGHEVRWFGPGATPANGASREIVDREHFRRELRSAAGVVGSAESQLLAECVLYGKPMLALYPAGDVEQELNAQLATAAQVAMCTTFTRVDAEFVERFAFRVEAREFARVALGDALRPASEVISELVTQMAE